MKQIKNKTANRFLVLLSMGAFNCATPQIERQKLLEVDKIIVIVQSKTLSETKKSMFLNKSQVRLQSLGYKATTADCTIVSMKRLKLAELGFSPEDPQRLAQMCNANSILHYTELSGCSAQVKLYDRENKLVYENDSKDQGCPAEKSIEFLADDFFRRLPAQKY